MFVGGGGGSTDMARASTIAFITTDHSCDVCGVGFGNQDRVAIRGRECIQDSEAVVVLPKHSHGGGRLDAATTSVRALCTRTRKGLHALRDLRSHTTVLACLHLASTLVLTRARLCTYQLTCVYAAAMSPHQATLPSTGVSDTHLLTPRGTSHPPAPTAIAW